MSNRQRIKGSPGCSTWKCHDGEEMGFLGYVSKWSRTQELRSFAGSQPNRTFCLEQFEVNIRTSAASVCLKSGWLKKRREWRGRSRGQGKENWIFPYEKSLKRKDWIREGRHDSIPNLCRNLKIIAFQPSSNCTTQLVDRGYGILWADVCRYLMCIICVVPSWCIVPHLGWSHGASHSLEVVVARPPVQLSWTERKALNWKKSIGPLSELGAWSSWVRANWSLLPVPSPRSLGVGSPWSEDSVSAVSVCG